MAVELDGSLRMRGDTGPGVQVSVRAEGNRLRVVSGEELVGDWTVGDIGIKVLQDGFNIRAEGEEFILHTEDDVALADEMGVAAASPRIARQMAARHNPEEPPEPVAVSPVRSNLGAIGFAVAGAMILLGGTFLNVGGGSAVSALVRPESGTFQFWLAFVIGGILMVGAAYVMSLGTPASRLLATAVLVAMIVAFGFLVSGSGMDADEVTAYGFIAGGLVVGVAVLVSGSRGQSG